MQPRQVWRRPFAALVQDRRVQAGLTKRMRHEGASGNAPPIGQGAILLAAGGGSFPLPLLRRDAWLGPRAVRG